MPFSKLIEREGRNVAAVITEPIMCNGGLILPKPGFLEGLRDICTREDILLIFDEVITGLPDRSPWSAGPARCNAGPRDTGKKLWPMVFR